MKLYYWLHRKYDFIVDWFVYKFQNPFEIEMPSGNCPVQSEGFLSTGEFYYFRARGSRWRMEICESESEWAKNQIIFAYGETYPGDEFSAGWMSKREAIKFANKAVKFYYQKREI